MKSGRWRREMRWNKLDLYKRYASDPDFKRAFDATIMRILEQRLAS